jgi:tRNA threonylcarbamoyladenosine biosynthesis protein TsaB
MAIILNIDSAVDTASVCLARDTKVLSAFINDKQKDHASWLHVGIKEIFEKNDLGMASLDAVAVTQGPGSYTGLRIGMATAKGICYALNKPLITLNTLLVMANAAIWKTNDYGLMTNDVLLCPMIDARRLEVFTALYTPQLQTIKEPAAITLNEKDFDEELANSRICFFGNGSNKFQKMKAHQNAYFSEINFDATAMVLLADEKFNKKEFADLAYVEPLYLKEFYTPARSSFTK